MSDAYKAYLLIFVGLILLVVNLDILDINFGDLWPLIILGISVVFFINWNKERNNSGLLFVGILLSTNGLLFLFNAITDWELMEYLWPVFILAPGLGFLGMYSVDRKKDKGLIIPAYILIGLSVIFLVLQSPLDEFWPLILIAIGIVILFQSKMSLQSNNVNTSSSENIENK